MRTNTCVAPETCRLNDFGIVAYDCYYILFEKCKMQGHVGPIHTLESRVHSLTIICNFTCVLFSALFSLLTITGIYDGAEVLHSSNNWNTARALRMGLPMDARRFMDKDRSFTVTFATNFADFRAPSARRKIS